MVSIQTIFVWFSCISVALTYSGAEISAYSNSFQSFPQTQSEALETDNPFSGEKPDWLFNKSSESKQNSPTSKQPYEGKDWKDLMLFSIGVLFITFLCVVFLFVGKSWFPSLYAGYLQIRMMLFILILTCGVNITCYYWIFSDSLRHGELFAACFYIVPLTLFIGTLLAYRAIYSKIVWHDMQRLKKNAGKPNQEICNLVNNLIYELGIKTKVAVVHSDISDISPYVVGASNECCVVLPSNYDDLLKDTCENDTLKEGLNRLILSHELAHIKNGDIYLLSFYWAITKVFKWFCLVSIALYFFINIVIESASVTLLYTKDLVFFNLAVLCILYVSIRYILKKRECLADAVATLSMNPEIILELTTESENALSLLEAYIFSLASKSPLNKFCFGYAFNKQGRFWGLRIFNKKVSDFRLSYLNRVRDYISKNIALDKFCVSIKDILFIAAFTAIIFSAARFIKFGFIAHSFIAFNKPDNIGFATLFKIADKIDYSRFFTTGLNLYLNIILSVVTANYLLMLHKDSSGQSKIDMVTLYLSGVHQKFKRHPFLSSEASDTTISKIILFSNKLAIVYYIISCFIFFNLFISWIPSPSWEPFRFVWMYLHPPNLLTYLLTSIMIYMLTFLQVERYYFPRTTIRIPVPFKMDVNIEFFKFMSRFICLGLMIVLFVILNSSLHVLTILSIAIFADCLSQYLFEYTAMKIFSKHHYFRHECLIYQRVLWKKYYLPLCNLRDKKINGRIVKNIFIHQLITQIIPFCLICFVCYVLLLKCDLWYFNNTDSPNGLYCRMLDGEADSGSFRTVFLILCKKFKLPPNIGIASMLLSFFLLFTAWALLFSACRIRTPSVKKRIKVFAKIKFQVLIQNLLKLDEHVKSREMKYFTNHVLSKVSSKHPYIFDTEKTPLMTSTCDAISILFRKNLNTTKMQDMTGWVKECMSPNGGFAAQPGIEPDVYHTYFALMMLNEIKQLDSTVKHKNYTWLKDQLHEFMDYDGGLITDRDWLFHVNSILLGIPLVSSGENFPKDEADLLSREAYWRWQKNKHSLVFTRLFVSITKTLELSNAVYNDELSTWLYDYERKLPSLSVKSQLADIVEYVTILSYMYPQTYLHRDSVIQVRDSIDKLYKNV